MKTGLSLVTVPILNKNILDHIKAIGFSKIDLAPSHFLDEESNFKDISAFKLEEIRNSGIGISSIQGLLHGLDPAAISMEELSHRVNNLVKAAHSLDTSLFVLGAPNFRGNHLLWERILRLLCKKLLNANIKLAVENICSTPCINKPFGNVDLDSLGFRYVLDTSNALECENSCYKQWVSNHDFDYLHLSYRNHSLPSSFSEFLEINSFLNSITCRPETTWELSKINMNELEKDFEIIARFERETSN